ncbi:MAG: DNA mismatch repair protein MutS [Rickettsiales bacterium]|jgi:DNA mismatch repair protein MutS|nr:DNA mismatch repair protein MutS [Rickettsiales bacterium]
MGKKTELSPAMRQYLDMKDEVPDAVLMFRMGDFYESFFGDAARVSKAVDLVLTRRGTDERGVEIPMCGIPWHAADNYFGRLVRQGISVAIADQMETPEEAKERGHKQIDRQITRVITAGTLTDDNLLAPKKSNYLAAVAGADIAAVDISTGELLVGSSENLFDDLSKLSPAEVLYDEKFAETPETRRIRGAFNTTPLNGRQYDSFEKPNDAEKMIAAYLKQTQRDAALKLSAPRKLWAGDQLLIDANTWKSLEIDAPLNGGGTTLLDIIDRTKTAAGGRKLRQWIRNLSGEAAAIGARQEHVAHLFGNRGALRDWTGLSGRIPDVGRSLSRLESGRGTPRDLRAVSNFLEALPELKAAGSKLDSALALRFQGLELFGDLAAELSSAVAENLPAFFREGGVIKRGFGAELDEARDLASGAKDAIAALQSKYANSTGAGGLKIKYNGVIGYYIEVAAKNAAPLTDPKNGFIHRQTMSDNMRFTTAELSELDSKVKNAAARGAAIEQEIISGLLEHIAEKADGIGGAADLMAEIDVYAALANVAGDMGWVRPKIAKGPVFNVIGGRHPVVEKTLREQAGMFVKNDCELNKKRIALLTGPNMSGKSTYLRQNALIVVLAHLGSFVPADSAEIGIADQLFSRVGASDNLASGQSTFMVEMSETANILNRATPKSFIIFDEIGRGTATFDGMAIARAVLEYTSGIGARCLFATHYHELTETKPSNVKNLTIKIAEDDGEIIFMHKIIDGTADRSYGIHVAKMAGMPEAVLESATRILAELENGENEQKFAIGPDLEQDEQLSLF